jgi:hypothetical protein
VGSCNPIVLPKEVGPQDAASLGLMQEQSRVSVKIVGQGNFSTTTIFTSKQVPYKKKQQGEEKNIIKLYYEVLDS